MVVVVPSCSERSKIVASVNKKETQSFPTDVNQEQLFFSFVLPVLLPRLNVVYPHLVVVPSPSHPEIQGAQSHSVPYLISLFFLKLGLSKQKYVRHRFQFQTAHMWRHCVDRPHGRGHLAAARFRP
jgi:hypothetical protein